MRRHLYPALTIAAVVGLALALGACAAPAPSDTPAAPTIAVDASHVIDLELTADLKIKEDGQQVSTIPVVQGDTYTFRVANTAGFDHDFLIGSDADLSAGAAGLPGIPAWSSGSREFQYTFDGPGPLAFGCTIPGHYAQMKGTFEIQP
ncbi:MAG TPA: hypothetical protein VMT36_00810 [Candidatus Saccharimonadia bacterium]|nr:hypothetical protein [Candidatus Saccharimonadia bacterium]